MSSIGIANDSESYLLRTRKLERGIGSVLCLYVKLKPNTFIFSTFKNNVYFHEMHGEMELFSACESICLSVYELKSKLIRELF